MGKKNSKRKFDFRLFLDTFYDWYFLIVILLAIISIIFY